MGEPVAESEQHPFKVAECESLLDRTDRNRATMRCSTAALEGDIVDVDEQFPLFMTSNCKFYQLS